MLNGFLREITPSFTPGAELHPRLGTLYIDQKVEILKCVKMCGLFIVSNALVYTGSQSRTGETPELCVHDLLFFFLW